MVGAAPAKQVTTHPAAGDEDRDCPEMSQEITPSCLECGALAPRRVHRPGSDHVLG